MTTSLYRVNAGDVPKATDVDQIVDALNGTVDLGTIALAQPVVAPASAPTAVATTGSNLGVGAYQYAVTYVTGNPKGGGTYNVSGETVASSTVSVTTTTGNQAVSLTSLPTTAATTVVAKRIYRTVVGGAQLKLVVELAPSVLTYVDTLADGSLGANAPTTNTTGTYIDDRLGRQRMLTRMTFGM
jgi:hypothetical protein